MFVRDNQFLGSFGARYSVTSLAQIHDTQGMNFANLPSERAPGSTFWVPDGQFGSNPPIGGGGGTWATLASGAYKAM